jgi:uncharacterized membrane protein
LVLVAGIFLKERYFRGLAYGAFAVTFFEIISLKLSGNRFLPFLGEQFDYRIFMLSLCTIVCLANVYFLNFPWKKHLKDWESNATTLFSVSATLMVILLTWLEVPETLVSAILGGTALVWYLVGRYTNLKDFLAESCILLITGFFALLHFHINQTTSGTHLHHGVLPFLILSLFAYGIYFLVRFPGKKLDQDLTTALSQFAPIYSLMGGITICLLITWRLPDEWIAPGLALVLAWYVALGVGFQWRDLCAEALLITLGVVLELVFTSWSLAGNTFGIPSRVVSVGAVILLLYCCQYLILRTLKDNQKLFMDKSSDSFFAFAYLLIPTLFFAALVKAEALTFNKNLLVALAWSGLGAIYLEISSIVRSKTWFYQGQALIAAGTVHLFMVNFVQVGYFGPLSLRLLTVIPFLGILAYGYFSWPGHGRDIKISKEQDDFRDTYLFGIVIVIATFILYEFHRAWVLVGWAGLSFGLLLSWQKTGNKHLRLLGSVMALASLGRVLGSNLYYRDQTLFSRPNLITIPLTCILILLDYGLLRRLDIGLGTTKPDPREKTFVNLLSRGRMVFLFTFIIILTSFIWVELSKAILTGFLGLEALLLVGIGFLAKEKLARLLGLGILVFCMVKLVLHDLTLSMGARAVVFIFSAAIMFGVSFIYTRFEKRLKEFL